MKKIFLQPVTADEEVIVQFTERTMVDKGLFATAISPMRSSTKSRSSGWSRASKSAWSITERIY